ncbi:MAG: DNA mismatch repair protein MutS [Candidatus Thermoplasmatota archaeon]
MMQQYFSIKKKVGDAILFFRLGDFYETFGEDAILASKILQIVLTSRNREKDVKIPMAGIPYHASLPYISKLIRNGYKVAVCEQLEDPSTAKGLVKRDVIRIITPGTVLEETTLEEKSNNYLVGISKEEEYGLAVLDVSTGSFLATQVKDSDKLMNEIARLGPKEAVLLPSMKNEKEIIEELNANGIFLNFLDLEEDYYNVLKEHFGVLSLEGIGCEKYPSIIKSAGAVLNYIKETQKMNANANKLKIYFQEEYLGIDASTQRNLEILKNVRDGSTKGTLIEVLDYTITPMGGREMKRCILQPLVNVEKIRERQEAVKELFDNNFLRDDIRNALDSIVDVERLQSKVFFGTANPREIVSLKNSLKLLPKIKLFLSKATSKKLSSLSEIPDFEEIINLIEKGMVDDPPISPKEGSLIRKGYNKELDMLREKSAEGKSWISNFEAEERKRTGIKSIKVGYNEVIGYYIEVSKPNLRFVPENYIRKQTMVNAERYTTNELKEWESIVVGADERIKAMEYKLFLEIRDKVKGEGEKIKFAANCIAELDFFASLAHVAKRNNYILPEVNNSYDIIIKEGRHPVVEASNLPGAFVPNDVSLNLENQIIILTGPNMAGKSTYMRQIALIVLMAQMGSFVPAEYASIGIVDKIFTRVGAFDDLTRGQSTFMVEMIETANIVNNATDRSLILLDEIGRGTSTYDGISIAWAVVEYIHNHISKARTLFATHFYQLTELSKTLQRVKNFHIGVKEREGKLIFTRKVSDGALDKSYGVQVASLAGLPNEIINRAKDVLNEIENESKISLALSAKTGRKHRLLLESERSKYKQLVFFEPIEEHMIKDEVLSLDISNITPLEALKKLAELQEKIKDSSAKQYMRK